MGVTIYLSAQMYDCVRGHVLQNELENAAFLFVQPEQRDCHLRLETVSIHLVRSGGLVDGGSPYSLELTDEERSSAIAGASREDAALVEVHSHPMSRRRASFSSSDLAGFKEFVPHVWWRLRAKPYAALVLSQSDFDAVAWTKCPGNMEPLDAIVLDDCRILKPTGRTLKFLNEGPRS